MKTFTKEDFLDLWRGVLPAHYTDPIENSGDGEGFDVPSAQAAMFAKFELALNTSQQSYFLRPHSTQTGEVARSGTKAQGLIQVARSAPALGEIIVPAGTVALAETLDSFGEVLLLGRYLTLAPLTLSEGTGAPVDVGVIAEYQGFTGNLDFAGLMTRFEPQGNLTVPAKVTSASQVVRDVLPYEALQFDRFDPELVGRYLRIVALGTPLLTENVSLVPRRITGTFESYDSYGQISVGVSFTPALAAGDLGKVIQVEIEDWIDLGVTVSQAEPILGGKSDSLTAIGVDRRQGKVAGESDDQFATRLVNLNDTVSPPAVERLADSILSPAGIPWRFLEISDRDTLMGFVLDLHPLDLGKISNIPRVTGSQLTGNGFVLLDRLRRYFTICVGRSNLGEFGAPFDATNSPVSNALDVMFFDGYPVGFYNLVGQLWEEINQKKGGGVAFQIVIDPELTL